MPRENITRVFSTSPKLLEILVSSSKRAKPHLSDYAGSIFKRDGIEILFVHPLAQLITVQYGSFLLRHYLSKFLEPTAWNLPISSEFKWSIGSPSNLDAIYSRFQSAILIAADIETLKEPLSIRCIGYCALFPSGETEAVVIPITDSFMLGWMRQFNALGAPKIFQNGKYDLSYLSMYNAVPYNYLFDTATMFHCWYAELPKDLAFLQGFCVRESMYWKDLAETSDLHTYYLYNAKDTHATLQAFVYMLLHAPAWAKTNYLQEFPLVFPCHLAEMTGLRRDMAALAVASTSYNALIESETESLRRMLGAPSFNPGSPTQVKLLLKVLGCADLESSDEKNLAKAALRHPLNARLLNKILDIRGYRKLASTYLVEGKEHGGRILYALNPHGTDTGRLASREHHFWCGLQIQNIPRGPEVKVTLVADEGFKLFESDLEQAESRDTAFISGDPNLQHAVSCGKDFHSTNASAFFGVPYESIYDDDEGKTKDKKLRDLAKRVNHGANYNMGANILVETMGEDKITQAKILLKLPKLWTHKQVAEYLLAAFHKTYPNIQHVFHRGVVHEVATTHMLVSKAVHDCEYQATKAGWARYCFGNPDKNKRDLNAYVAHSPQSLNAMTLNKAFMAVFYKIAINPIHSANFKLCAQIHDSILFQCRIGHEYLAQQVKELMEIPVTITGYDGITRTFTVPAALKAGADGKGAERWSTTE